MIRPYMIHWPWNARLVIPETFEDCLTYGQRQEFMWRKIKELEGRLENQPTPDQPDNENNG